MTSPTFTKGQRVETISAKGEQWFPATVEEVFSFGLVRVVIEYPLKRVKAWRSLCEVRSCSQEHSP